MKVLGNKCSPTSWKNMVVNVFCIAILALMIYLTAFQISKGMFRCLVKPALIREQVLNQLLWNNQFLRIGGKPVFCWKLFSRGIISVAFIMTNNGNLKPWSCFKADGLNFNDYFLLLGFFNSLPLTWKKLMKDEGPVHIASSHSRNTELKFTLYLKDNTLSLLIQLPRWNYTGNSFRLFRYIPLHATNTLLCLTIVISAGKQSI